MPNYIEPFERWGGHAGSAAGATTGASGGALLDALGRILSPLDWPRQAAWGAISSGARALDHGDLGELLGALPAAIGGVGGMLVGGPLGAAAGLGLAGALQGIGNSTGDSRFQAPTPDDAARSLGFDPETGSGLAASIGLGMAGDPMTWLGGAAGRGIGKAVGRRIGANEGARVTMRALEEGPKYPGGAEKILDPLMASAPNDVITNTEGVPTYTIKRLQEMLSQPGSEKLLGEVPPGLQVAGTGAQAVTYSVPGKNHVVQIRMPNMYDDEMFGKIPGFTQGSPPPPRPVGPQFLEAARSVPFEGKFPSRVEHLPFSEDIPYSDYMKQSLGRDSLGSQLKKIGEDAWDLNFGNSGYGPGGKIVMRDAGATVPIGAGTGAPRPESIFPVQRRPYDNILLRLLGSDAAIRDELTKLPRYGPPQQSPLIDALARGAR